MEPQRHLSPDPKKPSIPRPSGLPTLKKLPISARPAAAATSTENLPPLPREKSLVSTSNLGDGDRVLTADTDSFIIGDIIWVAGTKRGRIAFIGETQFAKGDWAGVVLDEPAGKNDGMVSGVRYFQCEPLHGTFTRLTRLSRKPLFPIDPSKECEVHGATPPRCLVERQRSPSPFTGTATSPGTSGLTTPFRFGGSSPTSSPPLKLGDRVIVQSSTSGTKRGVLRYIGTTEFAEGEWAGIELDQPLGKNDGLVKGKRYFTCPASHGLFAPVSKVSSSPSNRRPTSSIRRFGSKESLASNISSVVSTASRNMRSLRSAMREMEVHLDRLMQEKEIDRQELASLNNQLAQRSQEVMRNQGSEEMRSEVERYKLELESQKKANEKLVGRLDDLNRKYDDLQFSYEEEKIILNDVQSQLESQGHRESGEAEEELKRLRTELLESTVAKTKFEGELEKVRVELEEAGKRSSMDVAALADLSCQLKTSEEELKKLMSSEEEVGRLRKEVDELRRKLDGCRNNEAILTEQKSKFEFEIKELQFAKEELEAELKAAQDKTAGLLAQNAAAQSDQQVMHQAQILVLESALKTSGAEASASLSKLKETLHAELKGKQAELEKEISTRAELELELKRVEEKAASLVKINESTKNEKEQKYKDRIQNLEAQLKSTSDDASVLVANIQAASIKELKEKEEEVLGLMDQLKTAEAACALSLANFKSASEKEVMEKENELKKVVSRAQELKEKLKEAEALARDNESGLREQEVKHHAQILALESRQKTSAAEASASLTSLKEASEAELKGKQAELEKESSTRAELEVELKKSEEKATALVIKLESVQSGSEEKHKHLTEEWEERVRTLESEAAKSKLVSDAELKEMEATFLKSVSRAEDLEARLGTFEQKSVELESTKCELESQIQQLKTSGAEAEMSLSKLKEESEEEVRRKEEELGKVNSKMVELELDLKRAEEKAASLLSINESTQNEKEQKYKDRIQNLESQLKATSDDASVSVANIQEASRKELKEKEEEILGLKDQLKTGEAASALTLATLKSSTAKQVKDKEEELKQLVSRAEVLEAKLREANEKAAAIAKDNEAAQRQEDAKHQAQILDLESQLKTSAAEVSTALAKLEKALEELKGKQEQLQKLYSKAEALEAKLIEADEKVVALAKNNDAEQSEREVALQAQILDLESRLRTSVAESSNSLTRLEETSEELQRKMEQLQKLSSRAEALEAKLKEAHENAASVAKDMEAVQSEQEGKHQAQLLDLESLLKSSVAEASTSRTKLEEASEELQRKQELLQKLSSRAEALEAKLKEADEKSAAVANDMEAARSEQEGKHQAQLLDLESLLKSRAAEASTSLNKLQEASEELKGKQEQFQKLSLRAEELEVALKQTEEKAASLITSHQCSQSEREEKLKEQIRNLEAQLKLTSEEASVLTAAAKAASQNELKAKEDEMQKLVSRAALFEGELRKAEEKTVVLISENESRQVENEQKYKAAIQTAASETSASTNALASLRAASEAALKAKAGELKTVLEKTTVLEAELKTTQEKLSLLANEKERRVGQKEERYEVQIKELEVIKAKLEGELKLARAEKDGEDESQNIRFLNSIIVDLRQKNEQLTQKLEILLTTGEVELADHNRNVTGSYGDSRTNSLASSRLYCDICEEFDLHDTDDCPTQSSDPVVVNSQHHESRGTVREYCTSCEVFGHRTEDCDAEETF